MIGKILFIKSPYGALPKGIIDTLTRMDINFKQSSLWHMEEAYDQYRPSVVVFFHHFLKEWDKSMIERLEKITCHKILWDWECPWEIDYLREWHHPFTNVLVQDKNSVKELNTYSSSNKFIFMPHAADKGLAETIDVPFEYRSDLCFIGAGYPSRLQFFREALTYLTDYKVVIGGHGWEFLPDTTGQKIINGGVSGEDAILYSRGAKVVLNLHRLSDELTMANKSIVKASSPNNRFFELNMLGCVQMVDDVRPEIRDYYKENIIFNSSTEFLKKFFRWIKDESLQKEFKRQVQQETLEKHTYENRFIEIFAPLV